MFTFVTFLYNFILAFLFVFTKCAINFLFLRCLVYLVNFVMIFSFFLLFSITVGIAVKSFVRSASTSLPNYPVITLVIKFPSANTVLKSCGNNVFLILFLVVNGIFLVRTPFCELDIDLKRDAFFQ